MLVALLINLCIALGMVNGAKLTTYEIIIWPNGKLLDIMLLVFIDQ